jgi:hypothetical protein
MPGATKERYVTVLNRFATGVVVAVSFVAVHGCGAPAGTSSPSTSQNPEALVSIPLSNGNVVEIYDFDTHAGISEIGSTKSTPVLGAFQGLVKANRLVDLFSALQPGVVVPTALVDLQTRVQTARAARLATPSTLPPAGAGGAAPGAGAISMAPTNPPLRIAGGEPSVSTSASSSADGSSVQPDVSCNNSCCNVAWLKANICSCSQTDLYTYTWFLPPFHDGTSRENTNDSPGGIPAYYGAACAGTDTATFAVGFGSPCGTTDRSWPVPADSWRTFSDDYSCSIPYAEVSESSSVTSPGIQAFCGCIDANGGLPGI